MAVVQVTDSVPSIATLDVSHCIVATWFILQSQFNKSGQASMHVKDQWKSVMDGRFGAMVIIVGMLFTHSPAFAAPLPKPNHTKFMRFRIPFTFDPASFQRMNAKEIQLHVSRDHGAAWELTQTLTPEGGKFEYHASTEGEYWFSVKTVDGRNQVHPPPGTYETGLIVIVDATPPTLDLSLHQAADGKVQVSWKANDKYLDNNSLRIEYLPPETNNWELVGGTSQSNGDVTLPVDQTGMLMVRGSISDLSGNVTQAKDQMNIAGGGAAKGLKLKHRGPIATHPADHAHAPRSAPGSNVKATAAISSPAESATNDQEFDGPVITPMGKSPQFSHTSDSGSSYRERWSNVTTSGPTPISNATMESSHGSLGTNRESFKQPPGFETVGARQQPNRRFATRQRIVATRRFQLGYALADVGPSGVGAVELFITEDNGRKWWKYGDDPDHKSPFDVEVPRDGIYGFTIRARSGVGLSQGPPQPNEPPETVIAVDSTPPVVELFPIEQGRGNNINRLHLRWKVTEDHPAELPVSVEYAASLNGPWTPINGWREDTNQQLDWTVGPSVPSQFFVRVSFRDVAGNIGKAETQSPIVIDYVQPMARIVDVEVTPAPKPQN